jgi:hypothetical protein
MRHQRTRLLLAAAGAVVLVAVAALWWFPRPAANFDFLEGGRLVEKERQNSWFVHEAYHLDGDYEDVLTEAAAELAGLGYDRHRDFWNTPMRSGAEGVSGVMLTEGDDCVVVLVSSVRLTWRVRMQFWTYRVKRLLSRTASPPRPP